MVATHIQVTPVQPRIYYSPVLATTAFPIPFAFLSAADIRVYVDNVEQTTGFTVTGAGDPDPATWAVTFDLARQNVTVAIIRDTVVERAADFPDAGRFNIRSLNDQFDRITIWVQEMRDRINRSLELRRDSQIAEIAIADPVPHGILIWDRDGSTVTADATLNTTLLSARDDALGARDTAVAAHKQALASEAEAEAAEAAAVSAATGAAGSAVAAAASAHRAQAVAADVAEVKTRSNAALAMAGIMNNMLQLMGVVVPFLPQLMQIYDDFGWVTLPSPVEDWGWLKFTGENYIDWGLIAEAPDEPGEDWGPLTGIQSDDYGVLFGAVTAADDHGAVTTLTADRDDHGLVTDLFGILAADDSDDWGLITDEPVGTIINPPDVEDWCWVNATVPVDPDGATISLPAEIPAICPWVIPQGAANPCDALVTCPGSAPAPVAPGGPESGCGGSGCPPIWSEQNG